MVVAHKENVIDIDGSPNEGATTSVNVEASVDVGPEEPPPKKERRKQTGPFTSGLLKPIKATTELAYESIAIGNGNRG